MKIHKLELWRVQGCSKACRSLLVHYCTFDLERTQLLPCIILNIYSRKGISNMERIGSYISNESPSHTGNTVSSRPLTPDQTVKLEERTFISKRKARRQGDNGGSEKVYLTSTPGSNVRRGHFWNCLCVLYLVSSSLTYCLV